MPLTPSDADRLIRDHFLSFRQELVPLSQARGRILREPIRADRDIPPFNRVTMDGYALRSHEIARGTRVFVVHGFQPAGAPPQRLTNEAFSCLEVATGAVIPEGADCVLPRELVTRTEDRIQLLDTALQVVGGNAIHPRASDAITGTPLIPAGLRLRARELAIAASVGACQLPVSMRPAIKIVSTGDELVPPSARIEAWQLRRSNDVAIGNALASAGFDDIECFVAQDSEESLLSVVAPLLRAGNIVILTGGVSQGRLDLVPDVLARLGVNRVFHGISQRPGKPMYFGVGSESVPVFALPGNPAAAFITLHRYVLPALVEASVATMPRKPVVALTERVVFRPEMTCFLPVRLESGPKGELLANPVPLNTSGDYTRLAEADGFVELAAERSEFPAGYTTPFWRWA
jgi:molybdopterin molybdotransferase